MRLTADLSAGRLLERPAQTVARYVTHTQKATALTVTAPADQTAATNPITVSGTAVPGATIDVGERQERDHTRRWWRSPDGSFSFNIAPVPAEQRARRHQHCTRRWHRAGRPHGRQRRRRWHAHLRQSDPSGDDNGPGNYAYPTASDFHPGAYDLTDFQVYDTGTTVTFRVQTADLTPTFGSPLGAQLIDVYVHQPGVSPTSTAAPFPQRNYVIAPARRGPG